MKKLINQSKNIALEKRKFFDQRMGKFIRKYLTFDTYDFHSVKEEKQMEKKERAKKYSWKLKDDVRLMGEIKDKVRKFKEEKKNPITN